MLISLIVTNLNKFLELNFGTVQHSVSGACSSCFGVRYRYLSLINLEMYLWGYTNKIQRVAKTAQRKKASGQVISYTVFQKGLRSLSLNVGNKWEIVMHTYILTYASWTQRITQGYMHYSWNRKVPSLKEVLEVVCIQEAWLGALWTD